ncbi:MULTISPECIES: hypothetical protein [unclassified Sphingobium]|uniref:hypothetical protein n=1 Tax=unclassified Sphingobium TaxID=2611147 RepID=UPI0005CC2039|nr:MULTISPECIES: hypothetical protein [unclassified Sphingobium]AJR22528.1 hypothetical protein TZ53_00725 [Sphingobium sp. YBL2]UXC89522.1 hypothetical protein EGM87_10570 [Sphingobium sp. RSMS]
MNISFDPNAAIGDVSPLIRSAACGDLGAQRQGCMLSWQGMKDAVSRGAFAAAHGHAIEMMIWARLAASHGEAQDILILIAALSYLAEYWGYDSEGAVYGNDLLAEATALLDRLASDGNEVAADGLNLMAQTVGPHIFQKAKEIA